MLPNRNATKLSVPSHGLTMTTLAMEIRHFFSSALPCRLAPRLGSNRAAAIYVKAHAREKVAGRVSEEQGGVGDI